MLSRQRRIWGAALLAVLSAGAAPSHAANYTAIGDSITFGVEANPAPPYTNGFVPLTNTFLGTQYPGLAPWALQNRSIIGERITQNQPALTMDATFDAQITAAIADNPALITITVGANDVTGSVQLGAVLPETSAQFKTRIKPLYRSLFDRLMATSAKVVIGNVADVSRTPAALAFTDAQRSEAAAKVVAANQAIAEAIAEGGYAARIRVADIYGKTDYSNAAMFGSDGFHPSAAGHAALALLFQHEINGLLDTAQTGVLQVNTLGDDADGTCGTVDCSLRDAVGAANANADSTTITFAPGLSGTIQLGGSLRFTSAVILNGPANQSITVRGGGIAAYSLFIANVNTQITNLTLSNSNTVVDNIGALQVIGCTLIDNGAGILNDGGATLTNCTFVRNGMGVNALNTTAVQNCTITNNSTGLATNGGTLNVRNSIIAGNTVDINGGLGTDVFNLKNMSAAEAGLDPAGLTNNGGPTQTIGLLPLSPAVDAGDPAFVAPPATDQRGAGFARVMGDRIDIGAFEVQRGRLLIELAPGASDTFSEAAGPAATTVRLTRTGDVSAPLSVQMVSNNSREARFANATQQFGAGQRSIDVPVDAVDDTVADGTKTVIVRASASGFTPQTLTLNVTDNEGLPSLTLSLSRSGFYENLANPASFLVIKHNRASTAQVTVNLSSSDPRLGLPATATIPAGTREVRVPVNVTADPGVQGTVLATINGSAGGFNNGTTTATLWDVQATLSISSAALAINEAAPGNTTTLRISRNTPSTAPLTVNLSLTRGAGQATVAVTATIAAGQTFVDVVATAVNDTAVDGRQAVVVKAAAPGHTAASVRFDVIDNDTSG